MTRLFLFIVLIISQIAFAQNYALKFDGKDDQVDIFIERLDEWTISAWVKSEVDSGKQTVIGAGWVTVPKLWNEKPLFLSNNIVSTGEVNPKNKNSYLDKKWHHLAVSCGDGVTCLYIDGNLIDKKNEVKMTVPEIIGSNDGKEFFTGLIDEVRIWNKALTSEEINNWKNQSLNAKHQSIKNLIAYYTFDDKTDDATDFAKNHLGNIKPDDGPVYVINDNQQFKTQCSLKGQTVNNNPEKLWLKIRDRSDEKNTYRHLTWNIWHGGREFGDSVGVERVINVIKESGADIITMQETYGSGPKISKALGFYYFPIWKEGSNLSIMSRYPIVDTLSSGYHGFYCGGAKIKLPENKEIFVFDIWLSYKVEESIEKFVDGKTPEYFINADIESNYKNIKAIMEKDIIKHTSGKNIPIVVSGDFNSCSHFDWTKKTAAKGMHNGLIVKHPTSIFMEKKGFIDSFRKINSDPVKMQGSTWSPLYRYNRPEGDRIDFIYYKGKGIKAVKSFVINQYPEVGIPFPSDHAGVLTVFEVTSP